MSEFRGGAVEVARMSLAAEYLPLSALPSPRCPDPWVFGPELPDDAMRRMVRRPDPLDLTVACAWCGARGAEDCCWCCGRLREAA